MRLKRNRYVQISRISKGWKFERIEGIVYAVCMTCGFYYNCSYENHITYKTMLKQPYRYCPQCGIKQPLFDNYNVYCYNRGVCEIVDYKERV